MRAAGKEYYMSKVSRTNKAGITTEREIQKTRLNPVARAAYERARRQAKAARADEMNRLSISQNPNRNYKPVKPVKPSKNK